MSKNKDKHHAPEGADGGPDKEDARRQTPRDAGQAPDLSRAARDARPEKKDTEEDGGNRTPDAGRQTPDSKQRTTEDGVGRQPAHRSPEGEGGTTAGDGAATDRVAKLAQLQDQLLRLQADFDNFRKRTLREKNELFDSANQALMLELLPVLDHLHLGIQAASAHQADPAFREGLILIFDQLMGALSKFGLNPIETEKQVFDPNRFEAVNALPSAAEPEGTVLALVRCGYMLRNKLLRAAQVIVSSGPPPEEKADARRQTTDNSVQKADGEKE